MNNKFEEGQEVVCISDNFPLVNATIDHKKGSFPNNCPRIGETLVVTEILGDYLMFEKYNNESINWWHYTRFDKKKINCMICQKEMPDERYPDIFMCEEEIYFCSSECANAKLR